MRTLHARPGLSYFDPLAYRLVTQLQLNPDGSVRNLGGFPSITATANSGPDGIDERLIRFGLRFGF